MNKKAFSVAVASVAVAGTIAAPAMADETAVTPVEQAQQAVVQAQEAPSRTECIAPAKPGGGFDLTCKLIQVSLLETKAIEKPMRVTYMPGGVGAVAYNAIVAQRPARSCRPPVSGSAPCRSGHRGGLLRRFAAKPVAGEIWSL